MQYSNPKFGKSRLRRFLDEPSFPLAEARLFVSYLAAHGATRFTPQFSLGYLRALVRGLQEPAQARGAPATNGI